MRGGSDTVILVQVILFVSSGAAIYSANLLPIVARGNPLGIDFSPAPSPQDGPPLSAGASRDKSLLPAQIGGIVGAYLVVVCVVGIALILIGRRSRRQVQNSSRALDIEMVQPKLSNYSPDNTPISPGQLPGGSRNFSWPSPEKTDRNPYVFPTISRSPQSPFSGETFVDSRVVQADREMLNRDLEDLYAHVMEQEDAKAAGVILKESPLPPRMRSPAAAPQRQATPTKKAEKAKPASLNLDETRSTKSHSRTSSIISSLKSPRKKGIRGMRISSPILTPLSSSFPGGYASDEEPLSPRYYAQPPPPPPVPADQAPYTGSPRAATAQTPTSPTRSIAEQLNPYGSSQQHHRYNMSQSSVQSSSRGDPISATSATSQTPLYPPSQQANNSVSNASNSSLARTLPFRAFDPPLASPSFSPSTKTTVLERSSAVNGGLHTGGLRTPWSAGAVPYSPYQPFSPVLPITPRLVTKEDRKRRKKEEGRAPVLEMIKADDEMWDSGY